MVYYGKPTILRGYDRDMMGKLTNRFRGFKSRIMGRYIIGIYWGCNADIMRCIISMDLIENCGEKSGSSSSYIFPMLERENVEIYTMRRYTHTKYTVLVLVLGQMDMSTH